MLNKTVLNYLSKVKGLPFFYVVGDKDYNTALHELKQEGLEEVCISNYCSASDKFPSIDELIDGFRTVDVDYKTNKCVLVGLGEYLALRGAEEAKKVLLKLKTTTLGNARVVILLRGVAVQFLEVISDDLKIKSQQRFFFDDSLDTNIKIVNINGDLGIPSTQGIKGLIANLEQGNSGEVLTSTELNLASSLIPVNNITESYSFIKMKVRGINLVKENGTNEQWRQLNDRLSQFQYNFEKLFSHYRISDDYEVDFYEKVNGVEFKNWLFFISLKYHVEKINNTYLRYVVETTNKFDEFKTRVLTAILDISHLDSRHKQFYSERKKLVKNFKEEDIAVFIHNNNIERSETIYNLTDNTIREKQEIINYVANNGIVDNVAVIYPALASYLKKYIFSCGSLSDELTDYFDLYKQQKVRNMIDKKFLEKVDMNAQKLRYTHLNTRDNIINAISNKESTLLYWIDALGVEYLSYFIELAKAKGLAIKVDIARADLPTITPINKSFYETWPGRKHKESKLDEFKHEETGGFDFERCKTPIHLANELDLIETTVGNVAAILAMHQYEKVVIASDHGASRLAVLYEKEEKYETDTKGEHSGRCCKSFDNDLQYAIDENGYTVLADYGRFKGSRKANVEVHGGATLEEVVVPIISLSLNTTEKNDIKLLNKNNIVADVRNGVEVEIYISGVNNKNDVKVIIKDASYMGCPVDSTHFRFKLLNIKRSGKYAAEIYEGDSLIGSLEINVKGKTGNIRSDFDDLF